MWLCNRRSTGTLAAEANRIHLRRFARRRTRTVGARTQHAQPRSRQGHHVPPQKQLVLADDALPDAEHGGTLVRQGFHAHENRCAGQAPAPALRRVHLFPETGLFGSAGIHLLRHGTAAQRQYEHRPRRNRLLRPQPQVEHRVRADQDQGQPGAHQLFERPAIRRPQHRQQRVQPRPRFRVLRRIQHARGRGIQPLGQRFGDAGRRPQLGQFVQWRARLHGTSGDLPAGAVQVERRRDGGRFRRRGAGQDTRGRNLLLQPQGIAPERPARRRHAGRRDPQHRLLFRGFHPQIPELRILYRFHGTQLRPTAVRPPEQCFRIQRAGAQHTDQLPVRQEMGGRPA